LSFSEACLAMPQKQQNQCRLQPLCNSVGKKMSFQQTVKLYRPLL